MTQPPPDEHPVVVVDGDDRRSDRGDTLVELLLAMVLMAIVSVSLLSAFGTSFTDSAEVKVLNTLNTTLDQYAQIATTQIQLQANTAFVPCATVKTYSVTAPAPPAGYTVGIAAISYFNGSTFTDACPSGIVHTQLITITATGPACATYPTPGPKCLSKSLSFPVSNYGLTGVTAPSLPAATSAIVASPNSQLLNFQALAWPVPNFTLANCTNQLGASCTSMFTFTDNGDGVASLVPNANLDLGTYTLTIAASNGAGTATQTVTYVLNEATTIAVAASPSSSSYSSPVLLTAQVSPASALAVRQQVNAGTVTLSGSGIPNSCANLPVTNGSVTCTVTTLPVGTVPVSATYTADAAGLGLFLAPSSSATTSVTVTPAPTVTGLTVTSGGQSVANGSVIYPTQVSVGITVSPAPDGGTVTISSGGTVVTGCSGLALTTGSATCTLSTPASYSTVVATYSGDTNYTGSASASGSSAPGVTITKFTATMTVTPTATTSVTYPTTQPVAVTIATAPSGAVPTGTVTFTSSSSGLLRCGSVSLTGGSVSANSATMTFTGVDPSTQVAAGMVLAGTSGGFAVGTKIVAVTTNSVTFNQLASGAGTSLSPSFTQPALGAAGGSTSVALDGTGKATCAIFGAASYGTITVAYSGDANYNAKSGTTGAITISKQTVTLTKPTASSPGPYTYGTTPVTFTTTATGTTDGGLPTWTAGGSTVPCNTTTVSSVPTVPLAKTTYTCTLASFLPVSATSLSVTLADDNTVTGTPSPGTLAVSVQQAKPTLTASYLKNTGTDYSYTLTESVSPFNPTFDSALRISIMSNSKVFSGCSNLTPTSAGSVSCTVTYTSSSGQSITGQITANSTNLTASPTQAKYSGNTWPFTPTK